MEKIFLEHAFAFNENSKVLYFIALTCPKNKLKDFELASVCVENQEMLLLQSSTGLDEILSDNRLALVINQKHLPQGFQTNGIELKSHACQSLYDETFKPSFSKTTERANG